MSSLPFVNPQMVFVAMGAMVVPVLIHLLNRRRHRRVVWAAMRFLEAAASQRARRVRFEHWLLLLMRMLVVGLFGIAIARPFFPFSALASVPGTRVHRVLVIDDSLSMSAVDEDGVSRFDVAIERAKPLLEMGEAGDVSSVVTLGGVAEVIVDRTTNDARFVQEQLGDLSVTQTDTDVVGGLKVVGEIVAESDFAPGNQKVFVLSDIAGQAWGSDGAEQQNAVRAANKVVNHASLILIDVGSDDLSNLAISGFEQVGAAPVSADMPMRLALTIANHSSHRADGLAVDVFADDRLVRRLVVDGVEAGESKTERFAISGADVGAGVIQAKMRPGGGDAVAADNARYFVSDGSKTIDVLIVDGADGVAGMGHAATFLSTALQPGGDIVVGNAIDVTVVDAVDAGREVLGNFSVVVLCDVNRLGETEWGRLRRYVERGGGLIVTAGEDIDFADYNESKLLPVVIEDSVGEVGLRESSVFFATANLDHSVLSEFAEFPETGLFSTRVWKYLRAEPVAGAGVLLRFDDGQAALTSHAVGDGAVCFYATSVDMSWNNLPAKGDFVALMVSLVSDLARETRGSRVLTVGDSIEKQLSARIVKSGVDIETPQGILERLQTQRDEDGFNITYGPLSQAGRYVVRANGDGLVYTANVPAGESDVTSVGEQRLNELLACSFRFEKREDASTAKTVAESVTHELSAIVLAGVLLLLLGESWLATRIGAPR